MGRTEPTRVWSTEVILERLASFGAVTTVEEFAAQVQQAAPTESGA